MANTFVLFFMPLASLANAQNEKFGEIETSPPPNQSMLDDSSMARFRPGIAITVGIFTTIFSITFLILLYVKHCRRDMYSHATIDHHHHHHHHRPPEKKSAGVDRKVIQALPIFRFSSLRGQKEGLECAVCLNRFEPDEVMRLLPKCKHAFHVECVDVWLEANPTCPLCRYRVDPEDVLLVDTKSLFNFREKATPRCSEQGIINGGKEGFGSGSVSGRDSSSGSLEIIVEKPRPDDATARGRASLDSWSSRSGRTGAGNRGKSLDGWSSRRSGDHHQHPGNAAGSSGRRSLSRRDGKLPVVLGDSSKHRLEHRIILDAAAGEEDAGNRRWSDAEAAGMLYLGSEMIMEDSGSGSGVINGRSVSEITGVSRYGSRSNNGGVRREENEHRHGEGGVMKRWVARISHSQRQQSTAANSAIAASSSTSPSAIV